MARRTATMPCSEDRLNSVDSDLIYYVAGSIGRSVGRLKKYDSWKVLLVKTMILMFLCKWMTLS